MLFNRVIFFKLKTTLANSRGLSFFAAWAVSHTLKVKGRVTSAGTREETLPISITRRSFITLISAMVPRSAVAQRYPVVDASENTTVIFVVAEGSLSSDPGPVTNTQLQRREIVGSLAEALSLARSVRADNTATANIVIELSQGIHRLSSPLRLISADSGSGKYPLVIRGPSKGTARIRGSIRLEPNDIDSISWLSNVPEPSRRHVKIYDLPAQLRNVQRVDVSRTIGQLPSVMPFEVFDEIGELRPARWPKDGWAECYPVIGRNQSAIKIAPDQAKKWRAEPDLWIGAYTKWDWAFETIPVTHVDDVDDFLELARKPQFGFKSPFRMFFYHAISELTAEGEWYRDRKHNQLVVWPRHEHADDAKIELSVTESLFDLQSVKNVRLENLILEMTRGDAIKIRGGSNIEVVDCTIRMTGHRAVSFQNTQKSGISKSRIEGTGEGGILLSGGDRVSLSPGSLFVTNTTIENFSRLGRTYRPAVRIEGVGNHVIGNFIAKSPHVAILFFGNDHLIELNEITDVVTDSSDGGVIYTGRDWTAQGTVIRHNFLHDIRGLRDFEVKGVYLDDFASGITIEGNIFLRVDQPVFIGGGRENNVYRNVYLASSPGICIDGRGLTWAKNSISDSNSELRAALRAVPIGSAIWMHRYPHLNLIMQDNPAMPKLNRAKGNLFIDTVPYRLTSEVNAAAQTLEPIDKVADEREKNEFAFLIANVANASDVNYQFHEILSRAGLASLPFSRMDRSKLLH